MGRSASVVIIGAGIVGCSAAWHLAKRGWTDIVLVEQGPFPKAGGSSSHAPGIVFQTSSNKQMTRFALETVATLSTIHLDGEPCWFGVGGIEVAETPRRLEDLKRKLGWAQSWGVADAALLTPSEVAAKIPMIDSSVILGGYWVPTDGVAKPVRAVEAMLRDAGSAVTLLSHTRVTEIHRAGNRVVGVGLGDQSISTDRVLACGGIWGPAIGRMAGVPVPLSAVEHQFMWTEPMAPWIGKSAECQLPVIRHQDRDLYMRQRMDHFAVGSYAHEPIVVDAGEIRRHGEPDDMPASNPFVASTFAPSWADAVRLLPFLKDARPAEAFNGMFSFTPDSYPLLGESQFLKGFWSAMAIWITHSAGAARAVADWMTDGRTPEDLRDCDINRFEPHALTAAYIRERGAQQYREVYDVIHPLQPMERPRPLRVSPFYGAQQKLEAVFFEGRGWEQPRWYEANRDLLGDYPTRPRDGWSGEWWSPIAQAEHLATRERVALFDMTPLPKFEVIGPDAARFLQNMLTGNVDRAVGSVTYALMLDARGGVRSDVTVARIAEDQFQIGANGPLDLVWLRSHLPPDMRVQINDITAARCCVGLWGPRARAVVEQVSDDDWSNDVFPYYTARIRAIGEVPVCAMRVSYVGELGWELYTTPEYGARLWHLLWEAGRAMGILAAGRAAFDTLRIEKGYRLWGVDMDAERDPWESGVGFAVKLNKQEFLGRDAAVHAKERGPRHVLSCLVLDDPSVVVMGKEPIIIDGDAVGYVTSAGYCPTIAASVAYGYLPADHANPGSRVEIEYFASRHGAVVSPDPLFDPKGERLRA